MKKVWIAMPTFVLIIVVLVGFISSGSLRTNCLAYGGVGLAIYAFFAIFIYGLAYAFGGHSHERMPLGTKLLFWYLLALLIITVFTMIYFMAHN